MPTAGLREGHMESELLVCRLKGVVFAFALAAVAGVWADSAIAPKFLWSASEPGSANVTCDNGVTWKAEGGRFAVEFAPGEAQWPGFAIASKSGAWDLGVWGHVEMTLTNPGAKPLSVGLRVDNPGDWKKSPWNSENVYLNPGETKIGKVIFGYQYGFKKGYQLDPSKVSQVKVFLNGKSGEPRRLIVGDVSAAGASGEKPPVDPAHVVVKPKDGVIPGTPVKVDAAGGKSVQLKPASGYWNLGAWLKVVATVKNTGSASVTPRVTVNANGENISGVAAKALKSGETAKIEIPFVPAKPWYAKGDDKGVKPVGGTKFESHRVKGFDFSSVEGAGKYEVLSVKAEKVVATLPAWLGKRPPVEGKWTQTLAEEFNDGKLNEKVWSPYAENYWDKRTHFSKDNLIFKDGKCYIHYEKKTGPLNDDPSRNKTTDYACGILNSFDHWTQLYGYFEARMKLPTKPGLWPAFWTMPDRGRAAGPEQWKRSDTHNGGMEFDIMEHLTAWGPYRFNIACHWDGYQKEHRSIGSTGVYMPADSEGYITVGLLWLPGVYAIYGNGVELARWESERVANVPAHIFFYMVSGGWANEPLEDDELPDDFVIDWFRVWQRDDLAR